MLGGCVSPVSAGRVPRPLTPRRLASAFGGVQRGAAQKLRIRALATSVKQSAIVKSERISFSTRHLGKPFGSCRLCRPRRRPRENSRRATRESLPTSSEATGKSRDRTSAASDSPSRRRLPGRSPFSICYAPTCCLDQSPSNFLLALPAALQPIRRLFLQSGQSRCEALPIICIVTVT